MSQRCPSISSSTSGLFHGSQNQSHHYEPTSLTLVASHLSQFCLKICKKLTAHQAFDELPDSLSLSLKKTGKTIHGHGLILGISSKGFLGNALVDLYSKCGDLGLARGAFDRLESKDVFAWNSVLSMYSKWGSMERVADSFVSLQRSGVSPNNFTFAMVLSACAKVKDVEFGRKIHCSIVKSGFEFDSYCAGSVIDMYAKCNRMSEARRFFDSAKNMDTVSWTSMVHGYVQFGMFDQAIELFKEMNKSGIKPDRVSYMAVISACVSVGKLDSAHELFVEMPSRNVVAWNLMISGHTKAGQATEALMFFVKMRIACVKPTRSTLGSVLSAIASLRDLEFGSLVHSLAVKQGLDSNFYVGSSLINMYMKCENVEDSKKVFDCVDQKNDILWNALLGGYAKNRYALEVLDLFSNMKASGSQPSEFTYTSLLSACSSLETLELGRQFHSVIIKNKFSSNLFVSNALIDMYAKSGSLPDARKQFERMKNRDEVSWNAIIVGYVQEEDETEAYDMFRRMIIGATMPGEVTLASILSACANGGATILNRGQQVHCLAVKLGLETSLYAGSSLVDMYAKCRSTESARKVFGFMPHQGVVSMNALISGYTQIKNLVEAVDLFRGMLASGLNPTDITFASLLDGCDEPRLAILGTQIHGLVSKLGLLYGDSDFLRVSLLGMYMNCQCISEAEFLFSVFPNPKGQILWTSMISGLTQNGFSDDALCLYREMRNENVALGQATFASILRASALSSSLTHGSEIHSLVFRTGFDFDELISSALIDMYAKCGDVLSSTQVFQEMRTKNDVISWNSIIVGLAKNGFAEEAINIFDEMKQKHIEPDDVTFLGILNACSHAGKVTEGRQIFDTMTNPRSYHVACMVDLLGRWGFLKEAEELIEKLKVGSDPMIWSTFLGSCRLHGDNSRGYKAAKRLIDLDPKSSSSYVLLSNIYAASGNWNKADSLRVEMREKGVEKIPGCSWNDHAGVHGRK